jgi:hypothetical protein
MDLEVAGPMRPRDRARGLVDLLGRELRVPKDPRRARHLLEDPRLGLDVLHLVVDAPQLLLGLAGPPRQHQQRHLLGIGARHRVDDVVPARPVGDADDAQPPRAAGVAIGGEAHRGLVGEGDDLEVADAAEAVEEPEHEVAGKPEDVGHAGPPEIGDQEVAERHARSHRASG